MYCVFLRNDSSKSRTKTLRWWNDIQARALLFQKRQNNWNHCAQQVDSRFTFIVYFMSFYKSLRSNQEIFLIDMFVSVSFLSSVSVECIKIIKIIMYFFTYFMLGCFYFQILCIHALRGLNWFEHFNMPGFCYKLFMDVSVNSPCHQFYIVFRFCR